MKVEVIEKSPVEKILEIQVESERYEKILQQVARKAAGEISMPGFRKGKVPPGLLIRKVGIEGLKNDLLDQLIPEATINAIKEKNINPVNFNLYTQYHNIHLELGKPVKFAVMVEVKPEFDLAGYKGLKLKPFKEDYNIDEMTEQQIINTREQAGEMSPVEEERGALRGDVLLVDFHSTKNGEPVPGGHAHDYYMTLEDKNFIPGFVDHLVGHKTGEEIKFTIKFPEDYFNRDMAGQDIDFEINIKGIMKKELPELDDEFAKSTGKYQTLEEMKAGIRQRFQERLNESRKNFLVQQIIPQMLEQMKDVPIPPTLVNYQLDRFKHNLEEQLKNMNTTLEEHLKQQNITLDQMMKKMHPEAVELAKTELMLEKIAQLENISVTQEDIDAEIRKRAEDLGQKFEIIKKYMERDNYLDYLRYTLKNQKVYDLLIAESVIEEASPEEQPLNQEETPEEKTSEVPVETPVEEPVAE